MLHGVLWNLLLAVIPAVLGYLFVLLLQLQQKHRWALLLSIPVGIAWLLFLPNTCYLLTEWRHLLFDPRWEDMLDRGHRDPDAMLRVARWSLFFLAYSGAGALLFAFSIRPVERWLRSRNVPFFLFAPPFFMLVSVGVYLGLVRRFNSWDIVRSAPAIWEATVRAFQYTPLVFAMATFALALWLLYEAIDLWVDGMVERPRAWGIGRGGGGGKAPASKKKGKK